jgi:hypothetical protein
VSAGDRPGFLPPRSSTSNPTPRLAGDDQGAGTILADALDALNPSAPSWNPALGYY